MLGTLIRFSGVRLQAEHHPRFCSVGGDGKVMRWTCIRGELRQILLLDLSNAIKATRLDDGTLLTLPGFPGPARSHSYAHL